MHPLRYIHSFWDIILACGYYKRKKTSKSPNSPLHFPEPSLVSASHAFTTLVDENRRDTRTMVEVIKSVFAKFVSTSHLLYLSFFIDLWYKRNQIAHPSRNNIQCLLITAYAYVTVSCAPKQSSFSICICICTYRNSEHIWFRNLRNQCMC